MWGVRVGSAGGAVLVLLSVALLVLPGTLPSTGGNAPLAAAIPPGNYNVTFQATNLPQAIHWSVTLGGSPKSSPGPTIAFVEPNGTYNYTISSGSPEWETSPASGQVTVSGGDQTVNVDFIQVVYKVTFSESGLPPGTEWWVNVTSPALSSPSSTTSLSFSEPNGTYQYTIASANKIYAASGGSFTVSGSPVNRPVNFALQSYSVTFTESGLPSGTKWWVNVTSPALSTPSTTTTLSFSESNGSYSYTVTTANPLYSASPASGVFQVKGGATVQVTFQLQTYTVTFTESGLPSGTKWWVNVTSPALSTPSTTTTLSFSEPNGSYSYTVATANKIYAASGGSFTVSGSPVGRSIAFNLQSYAISFSESGLPGGTEWWVNITNPVLSTSSSTASLSFSEPNGTYQYTIATANKLYAAPGGPLMVSGKPLSLSVTFLLQVYTVTFTESGLPGGTEWWVNLTSGATSTSTGTTVTFSLTNGSYNYHVASADKRYSPSPPGSFTVSGGPIGESVSFSAEVYVLQFYEGGLPAGTKWTVALSGPSIAPENQSSTLPYIDFNVLNGTYNFSVKGVAGYGAYPSTAQVVVAGNVSVAIAFSTSVFEVYFVEQGLPAGTPWGITIGVRYTSNQPTINVSLPNGSYTFAVDRVVGYYSTFSTGSFRVSGVNQIVNVTFVPYAFPVQFSASGLPATENWSVTLGNQTSSAYGDATILFLVPNGTYPFQVNDLLLYLPDSGTDPGSCGGNVTLPAGNVSVCGRATTLPVIFYPVPAWPVTFVETGLGQGVAWSVAIGGHISYGSSSTLIVDVPNGTYSYSLGAVPGYSAASNSGMIHMTGSALQVNVSFTRSGPTRGGPPTGLSETEWAVLAAGVVVAALIAVTVVVGRRRPGDRNQP